MEKYKIQTQLASNIYINISPIGFQKCITSIRVPVISTWTYHYYFNLLDFDGNPRLRYFTSTGSWITTAFTTAYTSAYRVTININDNAPYRSFIV